MVWYGIEWFARCIVAAAGEGASRPLAKPSCWASCIGLFELDYFNLRFAGLTVVHHLQDGIVDHWVGASVLLSAIKLAAVSCGSVLFGL